MQAGFTGTSVVRNYFLIRTILAVGVPAAFLFLLPIIGGDMSVRKIMVATAGLALAGLYLPGLLISSRVDKRQQAIAEAFPDALDMLVVCVEAGLGLDAAFTRVGAQIAPAHPILAGELGLVSLELRAGKSRADALRNFAKRIDLWPDLCCDSQATEMPTVSSSTVLHERANLGDNLAADFAYS